jgi:hypothetical protein
MTPSRRKLGASFAVNALQLREARPDACPPARMIFLHHALFVVSVLAMSSAAFRLASSISPRGVDRVLVTVVFGAAGAASVVEETTSGWRQRLAAESTMERRLANRLRSVACRGRTRGRATICDVTAVRMLRLRTRGPCRGRSRPLARRCGHASRAGRSASYGLRKAG